MRNRNVSRIFQTSHEIAYLSFAVNMHTTINCKLHLPVALILFTALCGGVLRDARGTAISRRSFSQLHAHLFCTKSADSGSKTTAAAQEHARDESVLFIVSSFLNDLCDADVLIHVVDASGETNECGEAVDVYDPANDIRWLTKEIQ